MLAYDSNLPSVPRATHENVICNHHASICPTEKVQLILLTDCWHAMDGSCTPHFAVPVTFPLPCGRPRVICLGLACADLKRRVRYCPCVTLERNLYTIMRHASPHAFVRVSSLSFGPIVYMLKESRHCHIHICIHRLPNTTASLL